MMKCLLERTERTISATHLLKVTIILLVVQQIAIHPVTATRVVFNSQTDSWVGGDSLFDGEDQFQNIVGKFTEDQHHRKEFCKSLNGLCVSGCEKCTCKKNVPFISYRIGCNLDYFQGIIKPDYINPFILRKTPFGVLKKPK